MLAITCSGGGNRGAAQAGALVTLLEAGVTPDLLVGSSVGAVNAAYLAGEPTVAQARRLVEVWRNLRGDDIFPISAPNLLAGLVRKSDHLCSSDGLRKLLELHLCFDRIEDAAIGLVVVATDLASGQERRLDRGPVVPAVLASAAIPGVFAPVHWGNELLVDGGVVANVPLGAAVAAGADEVWVLDSGQLCADRRPPRSALDVVIQGLAVMGTARAQAELSCPPPGVVIHHVPLPCTKHRWYSDFSGSDQLIRDGAQAAASALKEAAKPVRPHHGPRMRPGPTPTPRITRDRPKPHTGSDRAGS